MIRKVIDLAKQYVLFRSVLIALIHSMGWLYIHALSQYFLFRGEGRSGSDFGVGTFVSGWFWAIVWGAVVFLMIMKIITGFRSISGFFVNGVLSFFISVFAVLYLNPYKTGSLKNELADLFVAIFDMVGLGVLPEGRKGWAGPHAVSFTIMLLICFGSVLFSGIRWPGKSKKRASLDYG